MELKMLSFTIVIINQFTLTNTLLKIWDNDFLYYNEFPTAITSKQACNQFGVSVVDKKGNQKIDKNYNPIKRYGKCDHINQSYTWEAHTLDQVGIVIDSIKNLLMQG